MLFSGTERASKASFLARGLSSGYGDTKRVTIRVWAQ